MATLTSFASFVYFLTKTRGLGPSHGVPMSVSKKELAFNAARWMEAFKKERPTPRLGAVFFMFDASDPEGSAVCVGSINNEGVAAVCRGILKKLGRDPASVIIDPYGRSN